MRKFFQLGLVLFLLIGFTSCNPRKVAVLKKIFHDVEHAAEHHGQGEASSSNGAPGSSTETGQKYYVKGIRFLDGHGGYSRIEERFTHALVVGNELQLVHLGVKYMVRKNDRETFATPPTLADVPINGGETPEVIYHQVSMYDYLCHSQFETIFFNITSKMDD